MSRPYDAVLRIRRREVDDYGIAITGVRDNLTRIEQAIASRADEMTRQGRAGAADPLLSSHAYLSRLRRERAELIQVGTMVDAELDALREQATEAIAALRATEESAEQHEQEVQLELGRKEQAEFDDIAAARLLRRRG
jgi:flagellar export protein FliJ